MFFKKEKYILTPLQSIIVQEMIEHKYTSQYNNWIGEVALYFNISREVKGLPEVIVALNDLEKRKLVSTSRVTDATSQDKKYYTTTDKFRKEYPEEFI